MEAAANGGILSLAIISSARTKPAAPTSGLRTGGRGSSAEETRSQARNREIARERLVEMIRAALVTPKRRIATKPTLGSQRRRMAAKQARGDVKSLRGKVDDEE